jgi:hypothetical protein
MMEKEKKIIKKTGIGPYAADLLLTLGIEKPEGNCFDPLTHGGPGNNIDRIYLYLMGKLDFKRLSEWESTGSLDLLDGLAYDYINA